MSSTNSAPTPIRTWLWPDHVAGKLETRQLREEHNHAINKMNKYIRCIMEIAAITTAQGTEAEDMAAQIQGLCREALQGEGQ